MHTVSPAFLSYVFLFRPAVRGAGRTHTHTHAVAKWRTARTPRLSPHLTLPQFPPSHKNEPLFAASKPAGQPLGQRGAQTGPFFIILSHPSPPSQRWLSARLRTFLLPAVIFAGLHPPLTLCYAPRLARSLRLCGFARPRFALVTPGAVGTTQADAARICASDCSAAAPAATTWHILLPRYIA